MNRNQINYQRVLERIEQEINSHLQEAEEALEIEEDNMELKVVIRTYEHVLSIFDTYRDWY